MVSLMFLGARGLRPPRHELRFEVTADNAVTAPRWVLLPDTLAAAPTGISLEPWSIAGYALGPTGAVPAVHAISDGGFYAVRIPARASLCLRNMPFAWWGTLAARADVPVRFASQITVDGERLEERLGMHASGEGPDDVDATALGDERAATSTATGGPARPLRVELVESEMFVVPVELVLR